MTISTEEQVTFARQAVSMFAIYEHPPEFPLYYVMKRWVVGPSGIIEDHVCVMSARLDIVRRALPKGAIKLDRSPKRDSKIIEVWV